VIIFNPFLCKDQLDSIRMSLACKIFETICEEIEPALVSDPKYQDSIKRSGRKILRSIAKRSWDELVAETSRIVESHEVTFLSDVVNVVLGSFNLSYVAGTVLEGYFESFGEFWWQRHLQFESFRAAHCFATATNETIWRDIEDYIDYHNMLISQDIFWIADFMSIVPRPTDIDVLMLHYYGSDIEFLMAYPASEDDDDDISVRVKPSAKRKREENKMPANLLSVATAVADGMRADRERLHNRDRAEKRRAADALRAKTQPVSAPAASATAPAASATAASVSAPFASATAPAASAPAPFASAPAPDASAPAPFASAPAPAASAPAPVASAPAPAASAPAPFASAPAPVASATAPDASATAPVASSTATVPQSTVPISLLHRYGRGDVERQRALLVAARLVRESSSRPA
jgi:hypothetical protein